ncbi:MAG: glucosaminidase domain-containing protein [Bacteroidota bacterium]
MRNNNLILTALFLLPLQVLLGQAGDDERRAYIDRYSALAVQEMERTGVPASIKLAQAVLESRYGTSTLARKANNHFGIKCGGRWNGDTYYRKDDDYVLGKLVPSCFRAYSSTEESFVAHSNFLISNARYAGLFALKKTNYKAWARGLKSAGYATAKNYHKTLIKLIEELELYKYDRMASNELILANNGVPVGNEESYSGTNNENGLPVMPPNGPAKAPKPATMGQLQVLSNNDVKFVVSTQGQTLGKIAKELKIPVKWLLAYNDNIEKATEELAGGEWVYIQAKRKNFRGRQRFHEVAPGENMFGLSQRYGISLTQLYKRNQMIVGTEPAIGAKVKLRGSNVKTAPKLRAIQSQVATRSAVPSIKKKTPEKQTKPVVLPTKTNVGNFLMENEIGNNKTAPGKVSSGAIYHKVAIGDTLESLAQHYKTSIQQLKDWNGFGEKVSLMIGQQVRVK